MPYEIKNSKIFTKAIEYSAAYHCNLTCSGCSHMSPYLANNTPSAKSFAHDIFSLSNALHAEEIRLVGGEPLLNPEITSFIKLAKESKISDTIKVITNGLLLHKMDNDFWENVDHVLVTLYPDIHLQEKSIQLCKEYAQQSNTRLDFFPRPFFRTTMVTKPHPKDWITDIIFKTCKNVHLLHCHMIHGGKMFKCAVPPFLPEYLSRLDMSGYNPAVDAFDIHRAGDISLRLKEFLLSSKTMEACRFCLGYLGKSQEHHQLKSDFVRNPSLQNITRRTHLDYYKLLTEGARYYLHQIMKKSD